MTNWTPRFCVTRVCVEIDMTITLQTTYSSIIRTAGLALLALAIFGGVI
jgi:hypothetical protein